MTFMMKKAGCYKDDKEGVSEMCPLIEEYAQEYAKEYAKDCVRDSLKNNALNLLKMGKLSYEEISTGLGLPCDEVISLAKSLL